MLEEGQSIRICVKARQLMLRNHFVDECKEYAAVDHSGGMVLL